jgi:predicted DNA-binding protein (MmcQ/YjbR family)
MPKSKSAAAGAARLVKSFAALKQYARAFPNAVEEFPWGESAFKVTKKVFVFLCYFKGILRLTVKLPSTAKFALTLPFASPAGYGLGKNAWVTSSFAPGDRVPLDLLKEWIQESYRAIAPMRIIQDMEARPARRVGRRSNSKPGKRS